MLHSKYISYNLALKVRRIACFCFNFSKCLSQIAILVLVCWCFKQSLKEQLLLDILREVRSCDLFTRSWISCGPGPGLLFSSCIFRCLALFLAQESLLDFCWKNKCIRFLPSYMLCEMDITPSNLKIKALFRCNQWKRNRKQSLWKQNLMGGYIRRCIMPLISIMHKI